jgi:hypothetical protein
MNRELHAFVTRSAFALTLGHNHVDLVLDMGLNAEDGHYKSIYYEHPGVNGLLKRGLIEHAVVGKDKKLVWKLTRAGELVYGLLEEAGIRVDVEHPKLLPVLQEASVA